MCDNNFLELNKYKKDAKIGQGSFGRVFKVIEVSTGEVFAAKISILEVDEDQKSLILNLMREVNIISQLNHPSILKFIGYSPIDFENMSKPVIVTEYSPNGSLESIIDLERRSLSPKKWDETKKIINIYGIASAMSYLHSHNIIHRDLKTANILEDDYLFPKIADFGLSKKFHQNQESMSFQSTIGTKGTPIYIAPEIWETNDYTKAGDVYAFSYIIYEILTLEKPFVEMSFPQLLQKVINEGYRPDFKYEIPNCYRDLMTKCWSSNPDERPTFEYIVDLLKNNDDFVIDGVDKDEFYDYIDMIENYSISFDPSKRFSKIIISEEQEKVDEKTVPLILTQISSMNEFKNLPDEIKDILKDSLKNKNENCQEITLKFDKVVLIRNFLNSADLIKIFQCFAKVELEIFYPSEYFDQVFKIISLLAAKIPKIIHYHYFISDVNNMYPLLGTKCMNGLPFDVQFQLATNEQKVQMTSFPPISVTLESSVTTINDYTFNGWTTLTKISIPSSVTSIGKHSFNGCQSLKNITIPSSVTSILSGAFNGCSSLDKITIPSSVTSIENGVFKGCISLNQITIPSSFESIKDDLFRECSSLAQIEIPSSVNSIGNWSFAQCTSLVKIEIPSSVTMICNNAFSECKSLEQIIIPTSVNSIGKGVFHKCSSIKQIIIPPSVKIINEYTFCECKSLMKITIPSSVTSIGERSFDECFSLENVIIPPSVTSINNYAFRECKSLVKITIPSSVTNIGKQAFNNCSKLNDISFVNPSSLTSIGEETFSCCSSLTKISIPSSVKQIGKDVFKRCNSLNELEIPSVIYKFLNLSPSFVKNFFVAKYLGVDLKTKLIIT